MIGSGFDSISFQSLELSLLSVRCSGAFEVIAKSSAMFGDIGDGVESPGRITAVGGEDVYRGRCMGEGRGLFSRLLLRPSTRRSRCRISVSRAFVKDKGTQRSSLLSCLSRAEPRRQVWL